MAKDINDPQKVSEYIRGLAQGLAEPIEAIRQLALEAHKEVGEQIKWNSPSFFFMGEMKPFNPKEYKRDIFVLNIRKGYPMLVFPTGAKIPDESGFLEGDYTDGRRIVVFKNMEEVRLKGGILQEAIRKWIALVDR